MKQTPRTPSPASIVEANLACCQRLAAVAQESQARWTELGQRAWAAHIERCPSMFAALTQTRSWPDFAPALGALARDYWQEGLNAAEALTHTVLQDQARLAAGWSAALNAWLHDAAHVCRGNTQASKIWSAMAEQMRAATRSLQLAPVGR
ncbi:hypothetical protein [Bordetella avium]|uniref:hypothetical protein n=1 Tax=Bordetella avium TaxID=521 RepID=UPI000E0C7838|nr:hypothetical protein [Bordetella avium]AZY49172.1 hypothetical protein C0J09_08480 [Bordetella avium]RIQ12320.1 hypothetical protein D0432_13880 [Bordetella avium]RIQ36039.1 hypothetical protein D0848_15490 [Bordetella avium]RIQ40134.1 hypothetical protein D0847_13775 [Bordetella avium]RIQ41704.1 hypothetical protein D0846_14495 [Bordetella avium]